MSKHQTKKPHVCSDRRANMNPYQVTDLKRRKRYPNRFVLSRILLKQTVPVSRLSFDFSRKIEGETARALRLRRRLLQGKTSPQPIHTNHGQSPDFAQTTWIPKQCTWIFSGPIKIFHERYTWLKMINRSRQEAKLIYVSKVKPHLHKHYATIFHNLKQGFSNVFYVVFFLQIRVERKMRRLEKMQF